MAQREPIVIKSGIPTLLGTDTPRIDTDAHAELTTSGLTAGDVAQVSGALTLGKAVNTSASPIVGIYDGVTGSVVKEGVIVATFKAGPTWAGEAVYLSSTAGKLTTAKPTTGLVHEIGVVIDVPSKKILLQQKPVIDLGLPPPTSVWVVAYGSPYGVAKFWAADGSYATRYTAGSPYGAVLWTDKYIWTCLSGNPNVYRFNLDGALVDTLSIDSRSLQMAFDGVYVWMPSSGTNILKVDGVSGSVVGTYAAGIGNIKCICYDQVGNVWYTSWSDNNIRKMRCSDGVVVGTYATGAINNTGVTTDGTYVYSAGENSGSTVGYVSKFLISDGTRSGPYNTGGAWAYGITYDEAGYVWTNNYRNATVGKIRCSDGVLFGPYSLGHAGAGGYGITFDGSCIWATDAPNDRVRKFNLDGSVVGDYGNTSQCNDSRMLCTTYRAGLP